MERIKRRSVGTYELAVVVEDENGEAITVTAPATVTIRDGAGSLVLSSAATITEGKLTFHADADEFPLLDAYTCIWSGEVDGVDMEWASVFELVDGYLFEIADLRREDEKLERVEKYPAEMLREVRTWVEDVIEGPRAAHLAFVPRARRIVSDGTGTAQLRLPTLAAREVYAVTIDGVSLSESELADIVADDGVLVRRSGTWPTGRRNISVHYTHGLDRPPGAITRAALLLAREYAVKSQLPGRATATTVGDQLFRLTIAGRDGVTGLPDVDAAIDQFGRKTYTVS